MTFSPVEDHPRLRGENLNLLHTPQGFLGSPPPTRGKLFSWTRFRLNLRITPAYAGKTGIGGIFYAARKEHPRLRGENAPMDARISLTCGSPPPTRGKQPVLARNPAAYRITPAYAGKTGLEPRYTVQTEDHPRLRGENAVPPTPLAVLRGSPPPTRGKRIRKKETFRFVRITPAYAGKTTGVFTLNWKKADHPRLRGENVFWHL